MPRAGPCSGALLPLTAVKGKAEEEIHGCAGRGKEKGGRSRWSSLGDSGSAGEGAFQVQGNRQEEARAALIISLLQSEMGGRQPMNKALQPSREDEKEVESC